MVSAADSPPPPESAKSFVQKIQQKAQHRQYANAQRERDRYMWQSTDYTCKNCGVVWPKHSVTVSWRQTCVSECLKGKKKCKDRNEYTVMAAGALWITNKNVVGNPDGTQLTPKPDDVLEAEKKGMTIAVNPLNWGQYVFFPIKP